MPVAAGGRGQAVGVTGMRDLVRVRVRGAARGPDLAAALARDGVALKRFFGDAGGATAVFARDDLPDWPAVRARLAAALGQDLASLEEDLAAATVVGEGIGSAPGGLERVLDVARRLGVELSGHDAAPLRLTVYLSPRRLDELVEALHRELIGE